MLKKVVLIFSLFMLLALASVGADTLVKSLQVTTMPVNFYFESIKTTDNTYNNGQKDVPLALFYEGTTYLPLRYIGEKLGKEVGWDQTSKSVWVGKKPTSFSPAVTSEPTVGNKPNNSILGMYIGQTDQEVTKLLGKPSRIDKSKLGYEWWIYNQDVSRYIQVGIKNSKVVDIYSNSTSLSLTSEVKIGSTKEQLRKVFPINSSVKFQYSGANMDLKNDLMERPLVMINSVPYIFYIDIHNQDKVTAIRSLSIETLVKSGFYNMSYTYTSKEPDLQAPVLSPRELELVNNANEQQVFDLTNAIRYRNNLGQLTWNEEAANVARGHSVDMLTNHYFSHTSATTGSTLGDRMKSSGVRYKITGENIAMGYSDSIEAHEGWMNSLGHRQNILNGEYKTLGVGVKEDYYTQNFVTY